MLYNVSVQLLGIRAFPSIQQQRSSTAEFFTCIRAQRADFYFLGQGSSEGLKCQWGIGAATMKVWTGLNGKGGPGVYLGVGLVPDFGGKHDLHELFFPVPFRHGVREALFRSCRYQLLVRIVMVAGRLRHRT
jgi:hypothetical protein